MMTELKLRVKDPDTVERNLLQKGAKFLGEINFKDIYFNQPEGEVLKIAEKDGRHFLNALRAYHGTFKIITEEPIENLAIILADLTSRHGIKRILEGKRKLFQLQDYKLTLNFIDDVGIFLILTGENPTKKFIEEELSIKKPEYITLPFDEL
jgi:adenylate cyclase class IV